MEQRAGRTDISLGSDVSGHFATEHGSDARDHHVQLPGPGCRQRPLQWRQRHVGIKDTGTQGTRRLLVSFQQPPAPMWAAGKAIRITPDTVAARRSRDRPGGRGNRYRRRSTLTANASDNVGVAGVQFLLDGANLGAEDTTAPIRFSWNTATATRGIHTLTARARDAAGNSPPPPRPQRHRCSHN